mmetsp:Transcript_4483/g.12879  ORF Transcript_4483/g.12879 Transcript_4483/m.12879 type:complete len:1048 (-) Transcript_4483:786-3929(-)
MSLLDSAGVMTTDIWCTGAFSFESPLKDLLDSGDYTLEQLLAEDELLQELRGVHPQLMEYFATADAVSDLIRYVILAPDGAPPRPVDEAMRLQPPSAHTTSDGDEAGGTDDQQQPDDADGTNADAGADGQIQAGNANYANNNNKPQLTEQEKSEMVYIRFPYMACEVICCEIDGVVNTIVDGVIPTTEGDGQEPDSVAAAADENVEKVETEIAPEEDNGVVAGTGTVNTTTTTTTTSHGILDLLFSMLFDAKPGEIDDYRAGYFDKILSVLFRKRPQAMSQYLNTGGGRGSEALMKAMFKHLYSHSIMQIVQRLLLPQPPMMQMPETEESEENKEGDELYADTMEPQMEMDSFRTFRCDWSDSPVALKSLLDCLVYSTKRPDPSMSTVDEDQRLSLCQNASEVLITIIQNSPLTAPILHTMTTDPILNDLMVAGSSLQDESDDFSPHDSTVTCTMNVLESLILQLGGYGSVGTVILPEEDEQGQPIEGADAAQRELSQTQRLDLATTDTLRLHLPQMLESLSQLLLHPCAEKWVSPMQYAKDRPQHLLGSSRLRIVRLLESLVLLGDPGVDSVLCQSRCLEICLDLFWKFQWCSMLHQSVANLLVHVFEGANARSELQEYFIVRCNLLGRLMDSFTFSESDLAGAAASAATPNLSKTLFDLKGQAADAATSSVESDKGSSSSDGSSATTDSDDDDGNENENQAENDQDPSSTPDADADADAQDKAEDDAAMQLGDGADQPKGHDNMLALADTAPEQSFRLGYMGHVIIICQALVHACTCDEGPSETPSMAEEALANNAVDAGAQQPFMNGNVDVKAAFPGAAEDAIQAQQGASSDPASHPDQPAYPDDGGYDGENPDYPQDNSPLVLAHLVDTHALAFQWQDFISTTLESETAIQSTPLGGVNLPGGPMDQLHGHRPGLADEGEYDDDGAAPPMPPRGIMADGEVIDMDDNDLEVAANMMLGMTLGNESAEDHDMRNAQLLAGIAPQDESGQPGSYHFDDPLGGNRFGHFDQNDDDDDDNNQNAVHALLASTKADIQRGPIDGRRLQ